MVLDDFKELEFFTPQEFERVGGYDKVDVAVGHLIERIRYTYGRPLILTSAYREGDTGQHGRGHAVDLATLKRDHDRYDQLVMAALRIRCGGLGIYNDFHIHVDIRTGAIGARWIDIDGTELPWDWDNLQWVMGKVA